MPDVCRGVCLAVPHLVQGAAVTRTARTRRLVIGEKGVGVAAPRSVASASAPPSGRWVGGAGRRGLLEGVYRRRSAATKSAAAKIGRRAGARAAGAMCTCCGRRGGGVAASPASSVRPASARPANPRQLKGRQPRSSRRGRQHRDRDTHDSTGQTLPVFRVAAQPTSRSKHT